MISRVAESCFWLNRYVERAETSARVVSVNRLVVLDGGIHETKRWKPVVSVFGEQERFEELLGERAYDKDEESEEFMTWSEANPTSILMSLAGARENARMTREVISREMWETLNTLWQWLNSPSARKLYKRDRAQFYRQIRRACAEFRGDADTTILHGQSFHFMQVGTLLERATQTARLIDIKHHWFSGGGKQGYESPDEAAQWVALLRLFAAVEPFFKRHTSAPTGPLVTRFILQDKAFPRSVTYCLDRAHQVVAQIDKRTGHQGATRSRNIVQAEQRRVAKRDLSELTPAELHEELSLQVSNIAGVCDQLYRDFFDPTLGRTQKPEGRARRSTATSTTKQPA